MQNRRKTRVRLSHVKKKSFENDFKHVTIPKSDLPRLKKSFKNGQKVC